MVFAKKKGYYSIYVFIYFFNHFFHSFSTNLNCRNIHTKKRKREAKLVRTFLNDYANVNPFKVVVSKFRWKIIWTQRAVRAFLRCKRARINVRGIFFSFFFC